MLELLVNLLRTADEPDRREPEAPSVEAAPGGLHDIGMIGESQVVVRAEVDDAIAACNADLELCALVSTRSSL